MRAAVPTRGSNNGLLSVFNYETDNCEGETHDENGTEGRTCDSDNFARIHFGGVRIAAWYVDRNVRGSQPPYE